jgi:two-component system response regulator FixJ
MMDAIVFVVDDDAPVRHGIQTLLEAAGHSCETHACAGDFLAAGCAERRGALILDLMMPTMNGLELHAELTRRGSLLPIVFLTAHGDIPTTVRAIQAGAMDFLTKPVNAKHLIDLVAVALTENDRRWAVDAHRRLYAARLSTLTTREREVLALAIMRTSSKAIARQLGISHRTVELHRSSIIAKMGVRGLTELERVFRDAGLPLMEPGGRLPILKPS